jgi:hypothetical protein
MTATISKNEGTHGSTFAACWGVGGLQTGGTENSRPVDAERAETVSADTSLWPLGEAKRRQRTPWQTHLARAGECPRLPSKRPGALGRGQSLSRCPDPLQLKQLGGSLHSARIWPFLKQLKHLPTKSAGTGLG